MCCVRVIIGGGAGLSGDSINRRSPEYKKLCTNCACSGVDVSPSTMTTHSVSSVPWMLVATHRYLPESSGLQSIISMVTTPSEWLILYSYLLNSRLSLYHFTVGTGFPLKQHSNLHVSRLCITRGRKRNVKLGAVSDSSCQRLYGNSSRRRTGCCSCCL